MPIFALSICSAACLRGHGDAMRAMYVTIGGGLLNAALDPLLIFTFDLGMNGAALSTAIARFAMMAIGFYGLFYIHKIRHRPDRASLRKDIRPFTRIAIPSVLTNLATPVGNGYVTYVIAGFGNEAVGAWAIISRLIPLSFCAIFALSGAVGPIIGQNLGAKQFDRVKQTLNDAIKFNAVYTFFIWATLALTAPLISSMMQTTGETTDYVEFFCLWLTPGFGLIGFLFLANATFNNLNRAHYSTWLNWTKATLGTVPFVHAGAYFYGVYGLLTGQIIGGAIIALFGIYLSYRAVSNIEHEPHHHD